MEKREIEESIREPYNKSVVGFTYRKGSNGSNERSYFIEIAHIHKSGMVKHFIEAEDVDFYSDLVSKSNKARNKQKDDDKIARKAKLAKDDGLNIM